MMNGAQVRGQLLIQLDRVALQFGAQRILDGISLAVRPGEFVAIVGPSGCGKSTLLRLLGGLARQTDGHISIAGEVPERAWNLFSYVFQTPRLVPWRTALGNVLLGMELRNPALPAGTRLDTARLHLQQVGLGLDGHKYPRMLSGGERQRVALARALAVQPEVILMDEPFAALDVRTRRQLQALVHDLWQRTQKTVVLVTHDLAEAVAMAGRIVVLSGKPTRVLDVVDVPTGPPRDVETDPELLRIRGQLHCYLQGDVSG